MNATLTSPRRLPALPDLSHHSLNVWRRNRDVDLRFWKTELFLPMIEPMLALTAMGLGLGRFVDLHGNTSYIRFLAPGILAQFPMFQATFACCWGAFFRMDSHGTYSAVASTPASLDDVVAGDLLWAGTRALINAIYIVAILLAFTPSYGIVRSPTVLLALPVALLLGLSVGSIALCFTALAPTIGFLGYLFNFLVLPMFWLSGAFFPLERLPGWLQQVAWALPLTEVIAMNRHLLEGSLGWGDLAHLTILCAEIVVFGSLAAALVRRRLIK